MQAKPRWLPDGGQCHLSARLHRATKLGKTQSATGAAFDKVLTRVSQMTPVGSSRGDILLVDLLLNPGDGNLL